MIRAIMVGGPLNGQTLMTEDGIERIQVPLPQIPRLTIGESDFEKYATRPCIETVECVRDSSPSELSNYSERMVYKFRARS